MKIMLTLLYENQKGGKAVPGSNFELFSQVHFSENNPKMNILVKFQKNLALLPSANKPTATD
jgi:hypothetical protein